jgi:uncharacterized repeat protein (TIGR04138 family)
MVEQPFWVAVDRVRERDTRYRREAYGFLMVALAHAVEGLPAARRADPARRHLSGPELLDGMLSLARAEFGPLAAAVFHEWGLERSEDVGEIVFQLIEAGQLSARPEDRREDFAGGDSLPTRLGRRAHPAGGSRA